MINKYSDFEKKLIEAYKNNHHHIKKSVEIVINRNINDEEKERLQNHCFKLSIIQMAKTIDKDIDEKFWKKLSKENNE